MSRYTMYIGLNDRAKEWLKKNGFQRVGKPFKSNEGAMYPEEEYLYYIWGTSDKKKCVIETLQNAVWAGGPNLRVALKWAFGVAEADIGKWVKESIWTPEECDNVMGFDWPEGSKVL